MDGKICLITGANSGLGKASQPDAYAPDVDNQDRLWNVSAELTGLAS